MAPKASEIGEILPKFTPADVETPQAHLFDAGPFRAGEIAIHSTGVFLNVAVCATAGVVALRELVFGPFTAPVLVVAVVVGWYVADLLSGVLHWAFDTWFSERMTAIRRMVLLVREHHVYPQQIFKYRWVQEIGIMSWFGFLVVALALGLATVLPGGLAGPAVLVAAVVAAAGVSFSLEIHKLGHAFSVGRAVAVLQRCGILLSPDHHMRHHAGEHDINYCIVNGWADRTVGRLGFFRVLERVVSRVGDGRPRHDDRAWRRAFGRWVSE